MARIFGKQAQQSDDKMDVDMHNAHIPSADRLVFIGYTVIQLGIMTWLNDRYPKYPYANLTVRFVSCAASSLNNKSMCVI
jgi:dsRNA-specific ribonuclease